MSTWPTPEAPQSPSYAGQSLKEQETALAAELQTQVAFLRQMADDIYLGDFGERVIAAYRAGQSLSDFIDQAVQDYTADLVLRAECDEDLSPADALAHVRRLWLGNPQQRKQGEPA